VADTTREEERSCEQARSSDGSKKPAAAGASQQGFVEGVELLLLNGCDVHLKDKYGRTALDLAIINKQPGVEAVLRAHLEVNAEAELLL